MALSHAGNVVEFRPHGGCERPADPGVHAGLDELLVDRDPAFWDGVADDLAAAGIGAALPGSLEALVVHDSVHPYRTRSGGYLFCRLDGIGAVFELHALFRPEGWGREASRCLKLALDRIFAGGAGVIVVGEDVRNWRSKPPKSFGFEAIGSTQNTPHGDFRTWILTKSAWEKSPVRRRMWHS